MTTDNDELNETTPEQEPTTSVTPGQLIKQAREAKGLSAQQVADSLRLRLAVVQMIEANEFDKLASPTFVRGYLRNLAKNLELDVDEVFAAYHAHGHEQATPANVKMQSFSRRKLKDRNESRLSLISYAIIIITLALVLIWWWQQSEFSLSTITGSENAPTEQEAEQLREQTATLPEVVRQADSRSNQPLTEAQVRAGDTSTVSVESSETPDVPPTLGEPQNTDSDAEATSAEGSADDAVETSAADTNETTTTDPEATEPEVTEPETTEPETTTPEPTEQPTAESASAQLVFEFNDECWVKVADATGEDIAIGVKTAGYRMPLTGEPPFAIILCRPEAVSITYNGDAVNLDNYVRDRSVQLTLD